MWVIKAIGYENSTVYPEFWNRNRNSLEFHLTHPRLNNSISPFLFKSGNYSEKGCSVQTNQPETPIDKPEKKATYEASGVVRFEVPTGGTF